MLNKKTIVFMIFMLILLFLIFFSNPPAISENYNDEWWNASWHYRIRLDISSNGVSRENWPVEYEINFTSILEDLNVSGTFDNNSIHLFEYDSSGNLLWEVPFQFDKAENYNASSNAVGELVFIMNGTTASTQTRYYYIYFDIQENGNKSPVVFNTGLEYYWDGEEILVNNTLYKFYIDTLRGENTSGLYRVYKILREEEGFAYSGAAERTREYTILTEGNDSFGFDLRNNATFELGPIKLVVRQEGDEIYWNDPENKTNQTHIVKEYVFYWNTTWFFLIQNIINTGNSTINRSSIVGVPGFDVELAYGAGYKLLINTTEPGSWVRGTYSTGGAMTGIINVNESGTGNFRIDNSTSLGRIGITLDQTEILPNSSIVITSAMVFGDTVDTPSLVQDVSHGLVNQVIITQQEAEKWIAIIDAKTEHTIYNRNESILIFGNSTFDPWEIISSMNATLDMGTPNPADDQVVILYDDGTHGDQIAGDGIFSGYFNLTNTSSIGYWNVTVRAYDSNGLFLNESYYIFNITDQYYVNVSFDENNKIGLPRIANATVEVKNYRQDIWIPGATLNCTFDSTEVPQSNITDYGNGTYLVTFQTPSDYGIYTLNCTAEKDGNSGYGEDTFTVESPTTNVSITNKPQLYHAYNITLYNNESYVLTITLQNTGDSSAYDTNITLTLPQNWTSNSTFEHCGDILISAQCTKSFMITIPENETPGDHAVSILVNWTNFDSSPGYNISYANVTVHSNPVLVVEEEELQAILAPGNETVAGNFTVNSTGNDILTSITFSVYGLGNNFTVEFTPSTISSLPQGFTQSVQVNVTVNSDQLPGIYTGVINVTSSEGSYDLINLTVIVTGTNMSIQKEPQNFTANVTYYQSDSFEVHVVVNNTGNVTAFYTRINLSLPLNWQANQSLYICGNLSRGENCSANFFITVSSGTPSGNYTVNISVIWEDIGIGTKTNTTSVSIIVLSNTIMEIPEDHISNTINHGSWKILGTFTVNSTGNDPVTNITFNLSGLHDFTVTFVPESIPCIEGGEVEIVFINITVPLGYPPGMYNGTVNITSDNDGYKAINLSVIVPANGSWYITPDYCEKAESPEEGKVCDVILKNTGNIPLLFNISPSSSNFTYVNETNFTVNKQQSHIFSVLYNVSGQPKAYYNSTYTITANDTNAYPLNTTLTVVLTPYVKPLVTVGTEPEKIQQSGTLIIRANVTSLSGSEILYATATVTRPDGTSTEKNMTKDYEFEGETRWSVAYPDSWGSTLQRGTYNVTVFVVDSIGENSTNFTTFQVYTEMRVVAKTYLPIYMQGDTFSVYYNATDLLGEGLPYVNTTLTVLDPNSHTYIPNQSYTTDYQGLVLPPPIFELPSDAPVGTYTLLSYSYFYDENASEWVNVTNQSQFEVAEKQVSGGLYAGIETTVVWYPESTMTFAITIKDITGNTIDPDSMNITVYVGSPLLNNIYFTADLNDSIVQRIEKGFYVISYVMPSNTSSGDYWAVLKASKEDLYTITNHPFRVATGGPYDVRINLLETETYPGDFLDFEIIIENMGEYGQDVDVEYWVSSDNQTYYYTSEAVYTPSNQNVTLQRSVYIFTNQPLGVYTLNVRVTYSTIQPAITKNVTFLVTEAPTPPPEEEMPSAPTRAPEAAPPTPAPPPKAELKVFMPMEFGVERGVPRHINIRIKNTGDLDIHDVMFKVSKADEAWFTFDPESIDVIKPDEEKLVSMKVHVPSELSPGEYPVTLSIHSNETSVEKNFTLFVFTSKKELIEFEIARLKVKYYELLEKTENAKKQGKDVSKVYEKLDDAKKQIDTAEIRFTKKEYEASLTAIYTAWNLLEEAELLLEKAKYKGIEIPWWLIAMIIMGAAVIVLVVILRKVSHSLKILMRGRLAEASMLKTKVLGISDIAKRENLRAKRMRLERTLALLESQYRQGVISKEAYLSLKKTTEEKIRKIDEEIRKTYV